LDIFGFTNTEAGILHLEQQYIVLPFLVSLTATGSVAVFLLESVMWQIGQVIAVVLDLLWGAD
jgi:hypothetical protein